MPKPTIGSVHQNKALERVAIGFGNKIYTARTVFPTIPVSKESDIYYLWNQGDIFRNEAEVVAAGAVGPRGGFSHSTATYTTAEVKFGWPIPDRIRANMDTAIAADVSAVRRCMDKVMLYQEIEIEATLMLEANWNTSVDGSDWTVAAGTPLLDMRGAAETVRIACGKRPNVAVMSRTFADHALATSELRDLIRYTGTPLSTMHAYEALKQAMALERLVLTDSVYDSAAEPLTTSLADTGLATEGATVQVWLGYIPATPAIDEPSAGYTFQVGGPRVRTYREEAPEQDVVEAALNYQTKVTSSACGITLNTLSA